MLDFGYYNMDCMEGMKQFPDKYFDLAIVDPPYGIGMGKRNGRQSKGQLLEWFDKPKYKISKWDNKIPNDLYFNELFRVSRNQIIWGGNYFKLPISRGWVFWDKAPIVPNYSDGELAWTSFDKILKRIKIMWNGKIRTGIEPSYKCIHPTQKPIKLYKWLLKNYAKEGDIILDTHVGSASSLIACEDMGFKYVGFELDEDYYNASMERLNNFRKQLKLAI